MERTDKEKNNNGLYAPVLKERTLLEGKSLDFDDWKTIAEIEEKLGNYSFVEALDSDPKTMRVLVVSCEKGAFYFYNAEAMKGLGLKEYPERKEKKK